MSPCNKEKNMKAVVIFILSFLLIGCFSKEEEQNRNIYSLDKNLLKNSTTLQVDTIGIFEDLIYAKEYLVYKDSILIVVNNRHNDVHFIELYTLNNRKLISKLYKLGDGPQEILSAKVYLNRNNLLINDYVKAQVAFVNIDSLLCDSTYFVYPVRHQVLGSPSAVPYKNIFLLENPYHFKNEKVGIKQNAPRFIVTDGKKPYEEKIKYKYYTRNVAVNGRMITNYERNRIIYANAYSSEIEIYDMDLNLLKTVSGPIYLDADFGIVKGETSNEVAFKRKIPYAYFDYCVDEDYVYLTYMGDFLTKDKKLKDFPTWILKFDWEGNFINSYFTGDYILSISKGEKPDILYATILNEEEVPILVKLSENEK